MTNSQLQGQVFNRDGVNYLVLEDNDWSATTLRVKRIDTSRTISEMALENIIEAVSATLALAKPVTR
jgi:hypothetical protein